MNIKIKYLRIFVAVCFFGIIFVFDSWLIWRFTSPFMVPLYHVVNIYSSDDVLIDSLNSQINLAVFNESYEK